MTLVLALCSCEFSDADIQRVSAAFAYTTVERVAHRQISFSTTLVSKQAIQFKLNKAVRSGMVACMTMGD